MMQPKPHKSFAASLASADDIRQGCAEAGCVQGGAYRAPVAKASDGTIVYRFFCREHARYWNGRWNYFADMDDEQAERLQHFLKTGYFRSRDDDLFQAIIHNYLNLKEEINRLRGDRSFANRQDISSNARVTLSGQSNSLPAPVRLALSQLQLQAIPGKPELHRHFRQLVKRYHPDIQKTEVARKRGAERVKLINAAYACLKRYLEESVSA